MARNILKEAEKIVSGARRKDYGTPLQNHSCTAELFTSYLKRRGILKGEITAEDVCFLNILQKISRAANKITPDTLLDIPGYTRNIELILEARKKRKSKGKVYGLGAK